jgi:hypothetical protein
MVRPLRSLLPLLGLVAALLLPAAAPAAEIGLNVNGGAAGATDDNWAMLEDTKTGWARHFVVWNGTDTPDEGVLTGGTGAKGYDEIVAQEQRRGIKTLFVVTGVGGAKPSDPQVYARFVGRLAERYKGRVDAYEVWNEADEKHFWPGAPEPEAYVALLRASYQAIKAADPAATVVFAPTTGNNYAFVEAAYAAGAKGWFDAMSVHTDTACLIDSPTHYYREDGRIARYTFLGYREIRGVMLANGDDKPIWMTEFGWSTTQRICDRGRWAGQKAAGVTEAQQAQFLREAYHCLREDPYVTVAMWFNSRDLSNDGSELEMYGLRRYDGSHRPAYQAFKDVVAGIDTVTGPCGDFVAPEVQILSPRPGLVIGEKDALPIRVSSPDTQLMRLSLSVDNGPEIRNFTNKPAGQQLPSPIDMVGGAPGECRGGCTLSWQGVRSLPYGKHRLRATGIDASGNVGVAEVEFERADPQRLTQQAVTFVRGQVGGKGRTRTVSGRVASTLPFKIPGKVSVEWQTKRKVKVGKGKKARTVMRWRKVHGGSKPAKATFRFTQKLRFAGAWRVRVVYDGRAPFRRTASCWMSFSTRGKAVKQTCARGQAPLLALKQRAAAKKRR